MQAARRPPARRCPRGRHVALVHDHRTDDGYCGSNDDLDARAVAGRIVVSGASAVQPIAISVAERLAEQHPELEVVVEAPEVDAGIQQGCAGGVEIVMATRELTSEEVAGCGVESVVLPIATGIDSDGPVIPDTEGVTFYLFVEANAAAENAAVRAFVGELLDYTTSTIELVGYPPLDDYSDTIAAWEAAS